MWANITERAFLGGKAFRPRLPRDSSTGRQLTRLPQPLYRLDNPFCLRCFFYSLYYLYSIGHRLAPSCCFRSLVAGGLVIVQSSSSREPDKKCNVHSSTPVVECASPLFRSGKAHHRAPSPAALRKLGPAVIAVHDGSRTNPSKACSYSKEFTPFVFRLHSHLKKTVNIIDPIFVLGKYLPTVNERPKGFGNRLNLWIGERPLTISSTNQKKPPNIRIPWFRETNGNTTMFEDPTLLHAPPEDAKNSSCMSTTPCTICMPIKHLHQATNIIYLTAD